MFPEYGRSSGHGVLYLEVEGFEFKCYQHHVRCESDIPNFLSVVLLTFYIPNFSCVIYIFYVACRILQER